MCYLFVFLTGTFRIILHTEYIVNTFLKKVLILKKIICTVYVLIFAISVSGASAAVLGDVSQAWQTDLGGGAVYKQTVYTSSSVGKQTENYVEYTPNSEAVPVVVNGASVYGKRIDLGSRLYEKKSSSPFDWNKCRFLFDKNGYSYGIYNNRRRDLFKRKRFAGCSRLSGGW